VDFAKQEPNQQVPESSLHLVKASFALRGIAAFATSKLEFPTLLFDSLQQPSGAGVRSASSSARELLYKSGNVCIDLHVQPELGSESVVVVGQLLDSMQPTKGMADIPVSLLRHGTLVSGKKTNSFGEFDFGFDTPDDVHIAVGLDDQKTVVVPLPPPRL